jgi:alpha-L-fucosidase
LGNAFPEGRRDLHGLPPEAGEDYVGFIKKQLTELLTDYGPVDLIWCDQYSNPYTGQHWRAIKAHIKSLQQNCIVVANNSLDFRDTDIHSYEYPYLKSARPGKELPPKGNGHPSEVCDMIGPSWFWNERNTDATLRTATDVVDMLRLCNERKANYLLNVAPDTSGLLPAASVARLRRVGQLLATLHSTKR